MDQDEIRKRTIERFEECERARAKALEEGKSEEEAHEAAKAIWNGWAEKMLAERQTLENAGKWAAENTHVEQTRLQGRRVAHWLGRFQGENDETKN
jgi:hypothetical protein